MSKQDIIYNKTGTSGSYLERIKIFKTKHRNLSVIERKKQQRSKPFIEHAKQGAIVEKIYLCETKTLVKYVLDDVIKYLSLPSLPYVSLNISNDKNLIITYSKPWINRKNYILDHLTFNPDNGGHTVTKISDLIYTVLINPEPDKQDVNITYYNNFFCLIRYVLIKTYLDYL